jgi:LacI family transcriptional regulator
LKRVKEAHGVIASSLARGRTRSIAMIGPDIASIHFAETALGAEHAATRAGCTLMLANTSGSLEQEKDVLRLMHQTRVAGVIMAGARLPDADLLRALTLYPAFVSINHPLEAAPGVHVTSEHAKGMIAAVEHLVRLNRRVIAYMGGPPATYSAIERMRGFRQAMQMFDRPIDLNLVVPYSANYEAGYHSQWDWFNSADVGSARWNELRTDFGVRGARGLLTEYPDVDGIVCFEDQLAFGVLRACAQLGRRVPEDIAVIGCDDIPLASQVTPTLTTQRIPRYQIGARAVERLIEQLNGERSDEPVVFPHELIFRQSAPALA